MNFEDDEVGEEKKHTPIRHIAVVQPYTFSN